MEVGSGFSARCTTTSTITDALSDAETPAMELSSDLIVREDLKVRLFLFFRTLRRAGDARIRSGEWDRDRWSMSSLLAGAPGESISITSFSGAVLPAALDRAEESSFGVREHALFM